MLMPISGAGSYVHPDRPWSLSVKYREIRTIEVCASCGFPNHVVVCHSTHAAFNEREEEFCVECGETIKADTCLAIFAAASSAALSATLEAFKTGRLSSSLKPPAGVL
jgi:hypothetical protein